MKRGAMRLFAALASCAWLAAWAAPAAAPEESVPVVHVAVVGGLVLCGVWPALAPMAERSEEHTSELQSH